MDDGDPFYTDDRFRLVHNVSLLLFVGYVILGQFVSVGRAMLFGWITPALLLWYYRSLSGADGISSPPQLISVLAGAGVFEAGLVLYTSRVPFVVSENPEITGLWLLDQVFTLNVVAIAVALGVVVWTDR